MKLPLVALTLGDPAGIGPEIALAAVADDEVRREMRLCVLGPGALRPTEIPLGDGGAPAAGSVSWVDTGGGEAWEVGRVQLAGGQAALRALRRGAELAQAGAVDALVTGPVSKQALHLAGEEVEGQTELLARWAGAERCQMMAVAGRLRVLLLTRHMPLAAALEEITLERVLDHLELLDETLRGWGCAAPHIALAGLNPHAGEAGLIGTEDRDVLQPAAALARDRGVDVTGPLSPDTVFARAARGDFDAVLALYHDQAFIPVKLAAPDTACTILCGLPYLRVSPAHGTAFDIAGKGLASPRNLIAALRQAAEWSRARQGN